MIEQFEGSDYNEVKTELSRLQQLGWHFPNLKFFGLNNSLNVDESTISFPSKIWEDSTINQEIAEFWAIERVNSISKILKKTNTKILWEIGAGNGNASILLRNHGFTVIPVEPLKSGASILSEQGFTTFCSTLQSLELPGNSIEAIGAFDVLEHLSEPKDFLDEVFRVLKPHGMFICTVPAYSWLYSDFDIELGHYRRYSSKSLKKNLKDSSLFPLKLDYLFAFLVIPALVLRRIPYLFGKARYDTKISTVNSLENRMITRVKSIFRIVLMLEKKLKLRMGLSIICVSIKK